MMGMGDVTLSPGALAFRAEHEAACVLFIV